MYSFLVLGFFVLLFSFLNKYKNGEWGLLVSFFLIFIFSAFRYNFGNDYFSYLEIYNEINTNVKNSLSGYSRYEYGWVIINILLCKSSFQSIIILTSLFICISYYFLIKKYVPSKFYFFAVFIFYFDPTIFLVGLSAIRQSIAIVFLIFSIDKLVYKKYFQAFLFSFLAFNFHYSSLILIPLLFLINYFNNSVNLKWIIVYLSIYFSLYLYKDFLKEYLELINLFFFENRYSSIESDLSMNFSNFIAYLIIIFFLIYSHNKLNDTNRLFVKLTLVGILIIPIDFILPLTGRLTYYFLTLSIFVFPSICSVFKSPVYKFIWSLIIVIVLLVRQFNFFNSETYSIGYSSYDIFIRHL
jgi:transmembrane protein EpsG